MSKLIMYIILWSCDQVRVFQCLQAEAEKAQCQQSELQSKLMEVDRCRLKAEETGRQLSTENAKLKLDLAALKQGGEW